MSTTEMGRSVVLLVALIGFLVPAPLAAQETGAIFGKLQLATGGAVDGRVRIELRGIGGMSADVQYTDVNGNFKFLGLQYGRYEVVLASDRFVPVSERIELFKEME